MVKVKSLPGVREELKLSRFKNGLQWFWSPALPTPVSFSSTLIRTDLCNKKDNTELVKYVTFEVTSWKTLWLMSCFLGSLALWEAGLSEKERSMWSWMDTDRQPPTRICQLDNEPSATGWSYRLRRNFRWQSHQYPNHNLMKDPEQKPPR